jgi:hypothetical protein
MTPQALYDIMREVWEKVPECRPLRLEFHPGVFSENGTCLEDGYFVEHPGSDCSSDPVADDYAIMLCEAAMIRWLIRFPGGFSFQDEAARIKIGDRVVTDSPRLSWIQDLAKTVLLVHGYGMKPMELQE